MHGYRFFTAGLLALEDVKGLLWLTRCSSMTKALGIFGAMLLAGCAAQSKDVYIVDFHNTCSYPVDIEVNEYSNAKQPLHLVKTLQPGEFTEILSYISFNDELENGFPDTYKLEISANQRKITLNKSELIATLEETTIGDPGNTVAIWKISSDQLCP